ncbi:MAG: hypothetical protein ACPG1A_15965, partial [Halioglobus sp.]
RCRSTPVDVGSVGAPGFRFVTEPPSADTLAFNKQSSPSADVLVGRCILSKWPSVGWCLGKIVRRNVDGRRSRKLDDGVPAKINFFVFYELDNEEVGTVLRTDEYGGDDDYSWYLLEGAGEGEGEAAAAAAVAAGATSEM